MKKINHKRKRMEEAVSVEGKLPSSSGKEEDPTHINNNHTHPPPPLKKLRPIRSLQQLGFHPPQQPPQQVEDMSAEMLLKMKAEMDASFINSFRSQLSNLPLSPTSSSSSESSGDSVHRSNGNGNGSGNERKKKKRKKLESFLENLMSRVIHKQEEMHQQLLELIETKERERISREQEWRRLEMDRLHRDQELRSQESARSLALISYIQTALGSNQTQTQTQTLPLQAAFLNQQQQDATPPQPKTELDLNYKRWPTSEVQALITLRAAHDHKFYTQATKASVWEEISAGMASMGFYRNARKCKEKWENINKYYNKAACSGSENAKSCPYFHELETLYTNQLITNGKLTSPRREHVEEENGKL